MLDQDCSGFVRLPLLIVKSPGNSIPLSCQALTSL
jgi:hypothetical protein